MARLLRGWRGLAAIALLGLSLVVTGASAAGALSPRRHSCRTTMRRRRRGPGASPRRSPQADPHTNPAHFVTPPEPHVGGDLNTAESVNWSGQIASGSTFTGVSAEWIVPAIQPTGVTEASATWIGIDSGRRSREQHHPDRARRSRPRAVSRRTTPGTSSTPLCRSMIGGVSPGRPDGGRDHPESGTSWTIDIADLSVRGTLQAQPVTYDGPAETGRVDRGAARRLRAGPNPPLANFGSATFTNMGMDDTGGGPRRRRRHGRPGRQCHRLHLGHHRGRFLHDHLRARADGDPCLGQPRVVVLRQCRHLFDDCEFAGSHPTGTVAFTDGSTALCTATLSRRVRVVHGDRYATGK